MSTLHRLTAAENEKARDAIARQRLTVKMHDCVAVKSANGTAYYIYDGAEFVSCVAKRKATLLRPYTDCYRDAVTYFSQLTAIARCRLSLAPSDAAVANWFEPVDRRVYAYELCFSQGVVISIAVRLLPTCTGFGCPCGGDDTCSNTNLVFSSVIDWNRIAKGAMLRDHVNRLMEVHDVAALNGSIRCRWFASAQGNRWLRIGNASFSESATIYSASWCMPISATNTVDFYRLRSHERAAFAAVAENASIALDYITFAGADKTFRRDEHGDYHAVDNQLHFLRPPAIHAVVSNVTLALATVDFTPYVLLWIVDWLPYVSTHMPTVTKLRLIESLQTSIRKLRDARDRSKRQVVVSWPRLPAAVANDASN